MINKHLVNTAYWTAGAIVLLNVIVLCITPDQQNREELYFTGLLALGVMLLVRTYMMENTLTSLSSLLSKKVE